ncbi:MAG: ArsR family transcriptional regulator [Desulfobacteraceae bacterium]|nr:MAG: ArsR family transcriptional regulator [Desulfobacteraceae bacterium]
MTTPVRISAQDAKARISQGLSMLVCIYDDQKFHDQAHLEGAIPMSEFMKMKPDLPKDTDIIFY